MDRLRTPGALLLLLTAAGCGHHSPTIVLPATTSGATTYPAQPPTTSAPASSGTSGSSGSGGASAPPTSSTPTPTPGPAPLAAQLRVSLTGPGPARVASDAREVTGLALAVENVGPDAAQLDGLTVSARGLLDDARGLSTLRLALDVDGDGRFDRAVDRVLASGGFTQDDGTATFQLAGGVPVAAGATLRLLVALDFSGQGRANDDLRLRLDGPAGVAASSVAGRVTVEAEPAVGPTLKVGGWVEPHPAFAVSGDGLFPRAVRDAQGRTHVAIYQNYNFRSDVWYTLFDGRTFSPLDDATHTPNTAWNQDLAVDAGLPHLIWEEWDSTIHDYAIRYCRFDANNFGWTPSEAVSTGSGTSLQPRLEVSGGVVSAVWEQTAPLQQARIFYRRRDAGGWSGIAEVSSAASTARCNTPAIARLPGDVLVIAWAENDVGQSQIVTRELTAAGLGRREVAASAASTAEHPQLLAVGNELHLVFESGGEVFHARRTAQGWSQPTNVSRSPSVFSTEPGLTFHAGAIHVVWVEDDTGTSGNSSTQIAHAEAVGGGFGPVELLTRGLAERAYPVLVSEGARLRLLWQDKSLGRMRIFTTWREATRLEAPRVIASPGGDPSRPEAARGDAGQVAVGYGLDAGGNPEVFVQVEDHTGAGFRRAENVSRSATPSYKPSVAVVGSSAWAAWEEQTARGFEVRVAQQTPSGWSQPAAISSEAPAYGPRVVAGAAGPRVVWTERDPASGDQRITTRAWTGSGWSAPVRLSPAGSDAWTPHAAVTASGALVAVWEDEAGGRRRIRLAVQRAAGVDVAFVASSASAQWAPRVAAQGEALHAIWVEDGRVRVAVRPAGAVAFDPPTDLTPGGSWSPDIAVAGGAVVACWEQWSGNDARATYAVLGAQGWSTPAPLDQTRDPARRTTLLGSARGGAVALWTTPGTVWLRERRED